MSDNALVPIIFDAKKLVLAPEGILLWPYYNLLVVSDLHLEKGAALSKGAPLPQFDTIDTIQRLKDACDRYRPSHIICLGDSFHTVSRAFQMPAPYLEALQELATDRRLTWITGNHDEQLPDRLPGEVLASWEQDGIIFTHEADPTAKTPMISGHFHPKARVKLRARALSAPCFVQTPHHLILPSFGSYTGGLNILHEALSAFLSPQTICHLIHQNRLYSLPFDKKMFVKSVA